MNAPQAVESSAPVVRVRDVVLCGLLAGFMVAVVGITSFFRLSPEAAILRDSAMAGAQGTWHKRIALNIGYFTTGLVRTGSRFFKLDTEPRAAIDSIRGGEVGVYNLLQTAGRVDHGAILTRADRAMSARRWDRVVGVSQGQQLVAVYVPRQGVSTDHIRCCVLVLNERDLVVAGARGNLDPLLQLAGEHLDFKPLSQHLALR